MSASPIPASELLTLDTYNGPGFSSAAEQAKWAGLADGSSDSAANQAKEYSRPIEALQILLTSTDKNALKAANDYINNNPALKNALHVGGNGLADGKWSQADLQNLRDRLTSARAQAIASVGPVHTGLKELDANAHYAGMLIAFAPIVAAANPAHNPGTANQVPINQTFNAADLEGLQSQYNPTLPHDLVNAGLTFGDSATLFGQIDNAADPTAQPDKYSSSADLVAYLKSLTLSNPTQTAFDASNGTITVQRTGDQPQTIVNNDAALLDNYQDGGIQDVTIGYRSVSISSSNQSDDQNNWGSLLDQSQITKLLDPEQSLGDAKQALDNRQAEAHALNRPIEALTVLLNSNRASEQNAALDYIRRNPALANALDVGGGSGTPDGKVNRSDAQNLLDKLKSARFQAVNLYRNVHTDDPVLQAKVRDAALLVAYAPLLQSASASHDPGASNQAPIDQSFDAAALQALASNNPDLGSDIKNAAQAFTASDTLGLIDNAGNPDYAPDGVATSGDLVAWLQSLAS